ncbi:hypothetical protein [Burkholderia ubonensis]|uniref:hypothetical protein n=2 Tax=Burkholderia ubonensis TaxID=101571 RepID=UPI000B1ED02D|nr:hypothetical protein [Burkholderia ubonensis]
MRPQIEFKHVLGELSVNRNDPCEVIREMVSNSYDAGAKRMFYAALKEVGGVIFFDDGVGLSTSEKINGITPWEAFFSTGKSTKQKGDSIGYKCQGSKLCFACGRILVATRSKKNAKWNFKVIENPRNKLDVNFDITPSACDDPVDEVIDFLDDNSAATTKATNTLRDVIDESGEGATGTLIVMSGLDTESFVKYFTITANPEESYLYNYIRFYTRHGDVRKLTKGQGFSQNHITMVTQPKAAKFTVFNGKVQIEIPFGYPYLDANADDINLVKLPAQVSRLRDGRFFSRAAKSFKIGENRYSVIFAIDGNRRAHTEYKNLARKGKSQSGIKLSDHRGAFISVRGIKICRYSEILSSIDRYSVLSEGDSPSHYTLIIDGDFDLVTNRNALSKKAYDTLEDQDFLKKIKDFLDDQIEKDRIFRELVLRIKKESSENLLNEQIEILNNAKDELKTRERFRILDKGNRRHLFLSPLPGEEYLVGVLYSSLWNFVPEDSPYRDYWRRIITFSTQGIDSLALVDEKSANLLASANVEAIEYKYEFNNFGPFNHALAIVDYIVAWEVDVDIGKRVEDNYTCKGKIRVGGEPFLWEIYDIENNEAGEYENVIRVINLKTLIEMTFGAEYR